MTIPPRVVGIDPSLTGTGIAWAGPHPDDVGCVTIGRPGITKLDLPDRVLAIDRLVRGVINEAGRADLYVIELPAFAATVSSGTGLLERNALWWLLVRTLTRADLPVVTVGAGQIKLYATGSGKALKSAVVDAIARRLPMFVTAGNDNSADAAVLCAMGRDHLGHPLAPMPDKHRAPLAKVRWPECLAPAARTGS